MLIATYIAALFLFSLVSLRIERTVLTAPILFTLLGLATQPFLEASAKATLDLGSFLMLAEVGLVLLLFTDASRTDLRVLKKAGALPARLLSIGMLLTIGLGILLAKLVLPELSIWEAGILSAILAPTDAGLGQCIVNSPRVPVRIRQALNVEAGLNDGLSVPFLLFFMALAAKQAGGALGTLAVFAKEQLAYGTLIGIAVALPSGWLLAAAHRRKWIAEPFLPIGAMTLPLLGMFLCEATGASMFIAAFVAGLVVQVKFPEAGKHSVAFTEEWGQMINLSVFFLFGLIVARNGAHLLSLAPLFYALLSLTVIRMLPVAVALAGTQLRPATVLFAGWFGPRGLASIVLGLVYLEQEHKLPGEPLIRTTVIATVFISILAHGLSAVPGISAYAKKIESLGPDSPENAPIA